MSSRCLNIKLLQFHHPNDSRPSVSLLTFAHLNPLWCLSHSESHLCLLICCSGNYCSHASVLWLYTLWTTRQSVKITLRSLKWRWWGPVRSQRTEMEKLKNVPNGLTKWYNLIFKILQMNRSLNQCHPSIHLPTSPTQCCFFYSLIIHTCIMIYNRWSITYSFCDSIASSSLNGCFHSQFSFFKSCQTIIKTIIKLCIDVFTQSDLIINEIINN